MVLQHDGQPYDSQAPVQLLHELERNMLKIFKNIGGMLSEMLLANQANHRKLTKAGMLSAI